MNDESDQNPQFNQQPRAVDDFYTPQTNPAAPILDNNPLPNPVSTTTYINNNQTPTPSPMPRPVAVDNQTTVPKPDYIPSPTATHNQTPITAYSQSQYQYQSHSQPQCQPQYQTPPINYQVQPRQKNSKALLIVFISLIVVLIIISIFFIITFSSEARFGLINKSTDTSGAADTSETTKPAGNTSYKTTIEYDSYYNNEKLNDNQDVVSLINKDSSIQRQKCPNTNINKIEEQIISYGVQAVNLCEMDETLAGEIAQSVKSVFGRYPKTKDYFTNLTLGNMGDSMNNAYAFMTLHQFAEDPSDYSSGEKTLIVLNPKIFLNLKKLSKAIKNDVAANFHPANFKRSDVVVHELGHFLTLTLVMKEKGVTNTKFTKISEIQTINDALQGWTDYDKGIAKEAYDNYLKKTNSSTSFDEFRATISGYAVQKDENGDYIYNETIAEAFSDYIINNDSAADASKEIFKVLDSRLEKM